MKKIYSFWLSLLVSIPGFTQASIQGKIIDAKTGEALPYVNVIIKKDGEFIASGSTDFEGNYLIPVDAGLYELVTYYSGYPDKSIKNIKASPKVKTYLDIPLEDHYMLTPVSTNCFTQKALEVSSVDNKNSSTVPFSSLKLNEDILKTNTIDTSKIYGKVTDHDTGEALIYVNIIVTKNGEFVSGGATDFDGNYTFDVKAGKYSIVISYTGYPDHKITNVTVEENKPLQLDIQLNEDVQLTGCPPSISYRPLIIDADKLTEDEIFENRKIRRSPTKSITEISSSSAGVSVSEF